MESHIYETYNNYMMTHGCQISTKHHLIETWLQCAPTHCPNMWYHTGNVFLVAMKHFHILISQVRNQIRITQTHVLQYIFMYKNFSRNL